ncbi:hypothetical protein ACFYNL_21210 [Streptomyces sp. NPDC007808]
MPPPFHGVPADARDLRHGRREDRLEKQFPAWPRAPETGQRLPAWAG